MALKLARDDRQSILQVGSYKTDEAQIVLDGANSTEFEYDTVIRIQVISGDNWIVRGTPAVPADETGMLMPDGSEITMLVYAGETVGTFGGDINITPVAA